MATDAATCHGLELAKLRPETLDARKAELPPTAILSNAAGTRAGSKKITNGVKQKRSGTWSRGVEVPPAPAAGTAGGAEASDAP